MSHFLYNAGLAIFSKAFIYGLATLAMFSAAVQGRKHPDQAHLQPWQGSLKPACAFAFIAVMEAFGKTRIPIPIYWVCALLLVCLAASLLWDGISIQRKARREKKNSTGPR